MDNEDKSLIIRLVIYVVCISVFFILFLRTMAPLALLLCLLLIITRAGLVALVIDTKKKRGTAPSQKKPGQ